jgi:hypothetical protein
MRLSEKVSGGRGSQGTLSWKRRRYSRYHMEDAPTKLCACYTLSLASWPQPGPTMDVLLSGPVYLHTVYFHCGERQSPPAGSPCPPCSGCLMQDEGSISTRDPLRLNEMGLRCPQVPFDSQGGARRRQEGQKSGHSSRSTSKRKLCS